MERDSNAYDRSTEVSAQSARQGKPVGAVRWVMLIGIAGAAIGMGLAWILLAA
jgi:hypothetical protein